MAVSPKLTAASVRHTEAREVNRAQKQDKRDARTANARDLKNCRWAMKNLYPKELAELRKDIKEQAKRCARSRHAKREVTFKLPSGRRRNAYMAQFKKDLPGFTLYEEWVPGYSENMGDFNAPCNVEVPAGYILHIGWDDK